MILRIWAVWLACAGAGGAGEAPRSVVTGAFLARVARVESGGKETALGRQGERGLYQIKREVWAEVSAYLQARGSAVWGFQDSTNGAVARVYASARLRMLEDRLRARMGRPPSAGEVYAAYNLGWRGFARRGFRVGRCPRVTREAVRKVEG